MLPLLLLSALSRQSPAEDYSKTWDTVRRAISTRYYARQTRKAEMTSLLDKYEPQAKAATSRDAFSAVVNSMIAEFHDSHFAYYTKDDQGYYTMDSISRRDADAMPSIGAWFEKNGDGYTVQMVLNGMGAEKAGLRKGDVITRVDGQQFTPVAAFRGKDGKTVALRVLRDGKTFDASADVTEKQANEQFLDAARSSARIIERNGKKIGYFRLWMMIGDDMKRALSSAVYGKLRDTDGFILDLRDGFGGRPEEFADPFFRPEAKIEWSTGPNAGYQERFGYQRPLAVLINPGTRSAKEVLASIMQSSKRATLVGVRTKGQVLGTSPQRVNDWSYLEIPMVDVKVNGHRLEGVGVTPDVAVSQEYDADGKDLALEAAVKKLAG